MSDPSIPEDLLDPGLVPHIRAALDAGLTVDVRQMPHRAGSAYLTHPDKPGCVIIEVGQFPRLGQPPELAVPVHPNRAYGSAVALDVPDTEPQAVAQQVLTQLDHDRIRVRFIDNPPVVAVDKHIPSSTATLTR
ncbi:hypothetical protein M3D63_09605 [Kocuria palustris]|uniref:hypothetical protein n=1 Tax=Kocuria palustris TaxID=71999 RepID=UPI0021A6D1C9|nr:hypothetical protein [Kocuria palustris]MCT1835025.1 hypothetical protein [Kocuria palustris]MDH5151985.1 hypothetical protein [Kocuria palustris]